MLYNINFLQQGGGLHTVGVKQDPISTTQPNMKAPFLSEAVMVISQFLPTFDINNPNDYKFAKAMANEIAEGSLTDKFMSNIMELARWKNDTSVVGNYKDYMSFKSSQRYKNIIGSNNGTDLFEKLVAQTNPQYYNSTQGKKVWADFKPSTNTVVDPDGNKIIPEKGSKATSRVQKYKYSDFFDPSKNNGRFLETQSKEYDEGYLNNDDLGEYAVKLGKVYLDTTPKGKSVLGARQELGKVYNPGSSDSLQRLFSLSEEYADHVKNNQEFMNKLDDFYDRFQKAKSDKERASIGKEVQTFRQQTGNGVLGEALSAYVGHGYAPTQKMLQDTYDELTADEKKEFSDLLSEDGIQVKNGKVQRGFYGSNISYDSTRGVGLFYEKLKETNPSLYNKLGIKNINDHEWDRRAEKFNTLRFTSEKDRDQYFKDLNYKSFNMSDGRIAYVDPTDRNNIIIPEVYRAKKVTPEEFEKWKGFKDSSINGYKDIGKPGVYERWITDEEPEKETPVDLEDGLRKPEGSKKKPYIPFVGTSPRLFQLNPQLHMPGLQQVTHSQANHIRTSPEQALNEISANSNFANTVSTQANPYTSGAFMADQSAKTYKATNDAFAQAYSTNLQDQRNVENINEQRIQERERLNKQALGFYTDKANQALNNYHQSWNNKLYQNYLQQVNDFNLHNQINSFNAVNPNYKIGFGFNIYETGPDAKLYVAPNGQVYQNNNGAVTEVIRKVDKDGNTSYVEKTKRGSYNSPYNLSSAVNKSKRGGLLLKAPFIYKKLK